MIQRTAKLLVDNVAPAFGLLMTLWIIWNVETRFFPVVEDFTVHSIKKVEGGYLAKGELTKSRNCEFIGLTIYASRKNQPKLLLSQFKKEIFGADVGVGHQTWGPWTFQFPAEIADYEHVEVQGVHRCHALWLQTTTYLKMDIAALPR